MAQDVRGVVARAKKQPVEVVTISVPEPGPGEARDCLPSPCAPAARRRLGSAPSRLPPPSLDYR